MATDVNNTRIRIEGAGLLLAGDRWDVPERRSVRGSLLLLHGGGQTRHSWHTSAPSFAAHGWTTLTLDARGHGDSEWAADGDYSMDAMVTDIHAAAGTLNSRPVLVGASMGGITSLVAQGESPDLASALVLVDIAPRTEPEGIKRITDFMGANPSGFASLEEVANAVQSYNPNRSRAGSLDGLRKNVRLRDNGRWYWHWDPSFMAFGDEANRQVGTDRVYAAARNIAVPALLVRGQSSDVVSERGAEEFRQLIPTARIEQAVAGHMVAGDDNDVFSAKVMEFLDEAL